MPDQLSTPDLCVVGGGTAGHALAFAAAALGLRCTLVDPRDRLGAGQAADRADRLLIDAARDHRVGTPFDQEGFRHRLGLVLADAAPEHGAARLGSAGVALVRAAAVFTDPRTLVAGHNTIRAKRIVLATGASPRRPGWAQALDASRLWSVALFAGGARLPDRLTVALDAPDGLAVAQALHRLGAAVTVVAWPGFATPFDAELMALVLAAMERVGVIVHRDRTVAQADADGTLHLAEAPGGAVDRVAAAPVMLALRPTPAIAGLALERAGIAVREGAPVVDGGLRTTNRRVFVIGDVLGGTRPGGAILPAQVGLVLRATAFRQPVRFRREAVPIAIRTEPGLAQVGSLQNGHRLSRFPLGSADGARGLAKVASDRRGTVIGAGLVGDQAAEAIGAWGLAVARGLPITEMAARPVPAGGAAEALRRAALGAVAARLRSPAVKRLIGWVRRLP